MTDLFRSLISNYVHNISRHFDRQANFFISPQVKRSMIISNKHGIYELPPELPNHLRLIRKYKENPNIS